MTAHDDLDRQLNDFLREGPEELPYQSFDAVRDRTDRTRQRVVVGPWRLPEMNKFVTIGLGTAAVVALVVLGAQLFGSPGSGTGGPGGGPTATVEPTATPAPTATPEPTPSPEAAPPLTQTFTSTLHGYAISYPEGWLVQAATDPWTDLTFPLNFEGTQADFLYDADLTSRLFLTVASQAIGESAPADWVAEQMASGEGCASTEPIVVGGATGLIGADDCNVVVVTSLGRGYWIQLYTGEQSPGGYDRAWFEEVLATAQLRPGDAVDAGASPSP